MYFRFGTSGKLRSMSFNRVYNTCAYEQFVFYTDSNTKNYFNTTFIFRELTKK